MIRPVMRLLMAGLILQAAGAVCGCAAPSPEAQLGSDLPASRIAGIRQSLDRDDALPMLIQELGSDDPAVRLFAIKALEKKTGQRLGYEPHADFVSREQAVNRWVAWYNAHHTGQVKEPL